MLSVSRRIMVSASRESVRLYLRELENLALHERRVHSVRVVSRDDKGAEVELVGKFLGLPWRGTFQVEFTADGGYRVEMSRGALKKMVSVFHLRPVTGGTILTKDEQYVFPLPMRPMARFLRRWIEGMVDVELRIIKEGAEHLNRKLQLQKSELDF